MRFTGEVEHSLQASDNRTDVGRRRSTWVGRVSIVLVGAVLASCGDPVFEPIDEANYYFSIYGYLDASADTQWVRVMQPRETASTSSDPSDATVTLEDLDTGEEVVLQDSIFEFGSQALHNFWTTMEIRPGGSYRLTAMRPDGAESTATVAIPEDVPVTVEYGPSGWVANMRIEGVEDMPFTEVHHHMPEDCEDWDGPPYHHTVRFQPSPVSPGVHEVQVNLAPGEGFFVLPCPVVERDIFIVTSGLRWPSGAEFSPDALGVVEELTNVENGLGFFGGVLTKTIPWES